MENVVLTIHLILALLLIGIVLLQRSEGGGLGIGGSPSGAFGARGAADFMTRATKWLAVAFVVLSIVLAALAVRESRVGGISSTLERGTTAPATPDLLADPVAPPAAPASAPAETAPAGQDPLAE